MECRIKMVRPFAIIALVGYMASSSLASTICWDNGGSGIGYGGRANWSDHCDGTNYGDSAEDLLDKTIFFNRQGVTGAQTVNLNGNRRPNRIIFDTPGTVTFNPGDNANSVLRIGNLNGDLETRGIDSRQGSHVINTAVDAINNQQWRIRPDSVLTVNGPVLGDGRIEKINAGTLNLLGSSPSRTGSWLLKNGITRVGQSSSFGSGIISLDGGEVNLTDGVVVPNTWSSSESGENRIFVNNGDSATVTGRFQANGGFTKTGAGTLNMTHPENCH